MIALIRRFFADSEIYLRLDPGTLREGLERTARDNCSKVVAVHKPDPGVVARARLFATREKIAAGMKIMY